MNNINYTRRSENSKKNLLSITNNWKIAANVDANLPNVKPYYERFFSVFYENSKQKLPKKQTTEKITVEIDAKICLGKSIKSAEIGKISFF